MAPSPVHGLPLQGVVPRNDLGYEPMDQRQAPSPFNQAPGGLQYSTGPGHAPSLYEVAPGPDVYSPPPTATTTTTTTPGGQDDDCPDELVCDECNWKPRGVRENLKGYLRKHKNTHKNLRFPCDVAGCNKDFGRQDNLKAHKRDKHQIDDASSVSAVPAPVLAMPLSSGPGSVSFKEEPSDERPSSEGRYRGPLPEHTVLWGLNY